MFLYVQLESFPFHMERSWIWKVKKKKKVKNILKVKSSSQQPLMVVWCQNSVFEGNYEKHLGQIFTMFAEGSNWWYFEWGMLMIND